MSVIAAFCESITLRHVCCVGVELMWEPVLQDKRQEHIKFCKYATELIELVSGKPPHTTVDPSLERIRRVCHCCSLQFDLISK